MRFVSPLLKRVVYPGLAQMGYLRRHAQGRLCVVTYHGVRPAKYKEPDSDLDGSVVSSSALRSQIRLLKSRYVLVTPELFRQWVQGKATLPERAILLTCDDGLRNTVTEMLPVLREEGASCLFFVTGASAGDEPQMLWYEELYLMLLQARSGPLELAELDVRVHLGDRADRRRIWGRLVKDLSRYASSPRAAFLSQVRLQCGFAGDWTRSYWEDPGSRDRFFLLTAKETRELLSGDMAVGAHSLSHPALPEAPDELAWNEISASRKILEETFGTQVWALAYPFGDPSAVTARETRMAQEAGFECAFVNYGGGFGPDLPLFSIPRVHVTADMTLGEFEAHVSGFYRNLRTILTGKERTSAS